MEMDLGWESVWIMLNKIMIKKYLHFKELFLKGRWLYFAFLDFKFDNWVWFVFLQKRGDISNNKNIYVNDIMIAKLQLN